MEMQGTTGASERSLERWGDLVLLERMSVGAHAEVFRARDGKLQREVAVMLLHATSTGGPSPAGQALLDEGRTLARIRHPNVVSVHGIDRHDGRVGLWMDLARGSTLEQTVLDRGAQEPAEVTRLGTDIGSALAAVHGAGLLHRGLEPASVVREAEGRYVLADFGLGLRSGEPSPTAPPSGTSMYMAPEVLAGSDPSARGDVYSLGLLMWFALAGRQPFDAATLDELRVASQRGPRRSLREIRGDVPADLAAVVERAIAPDPAARYPGAQALVDALKEMGAPRPASLAAVIAGAVAILAIAALAIWWAQRGPQPSSPDSAPVEPAGETYAVSAAFLRHSAGASQRLESGDRLAPGDRLSLELRASRPTWAYVLDQDERGERYLLFPQPLFDARNPLPADSTVVLPGTIGGRENAWDVSSGRGRERLVVVVSREPVAELEADLAALPPPRPGQPLSYALVGEATVERLRDAGGAVELPQNATPPPASEAFERFRALAGGERGVRGVWVRQVVLENSER